MKKFVSIGLAVFNGAPLLVNALKSLLNQSYTNFELIISDNCSTDATESICRKYAGLDSRIRYIRQSENTGATNFKILLSEARGDYFMWAAHDDLWSTNYLAERVTLLGDNRFEFVFPRFELFSVKFRIHRKRDMRIFNFIECDDENHRVLSFLQLHPSSHKCNIVYSFFRTGFIRKVYEIQDVTNDGLMGAVALKLGRGKLAQQSLFSKGYVNLWPGALDFLRRWIADRQPLDFEGYRSRAESAAIKIFPHLEADIISIGKRYKPYTYSKKYKI